MGSFNLIIDKITVSNSGNASFKVDVSHSYKTTLFAKYAANNNVSRDLIFWLRGDSTIEYEIEGCQFVDKNPNGTNLVRRSRTFNFIAGTDTNNPTVSSGVSFFSIAPQANVFSGNVVAKNNVECTTLIETSDKKFKSNIEPIDGEWALVIFKKLNFYFYDNSLSNRKDAGLIAQEVEKVIPQAVHTDSNGTKALNYRYIDMVKSAAIQHFIKTK